MFWKRKSESYIESERCDAELEYDEGRRLRLQGMYESAQESYQACIARLEALDEDDASRLMLRSLRGLGDCFHEQRRYQDALSHYLRAQQLVQGHTTITAETHYLSNRVGRTWQAMGEESKSEEAYRESVAQVTAFRGQLHADTALAHSNLAGVLLDQDRFGEAREHYEQSLEIRREIFPADHSSISQSLLELGKAWGRVGRYERAFMCLQKCKEMRLRNTTSLFGRDHARVADVILQIGRLEDKRGASGQAVREFRQCLLIRERVHEGVHASIASVLIHLGHALHHIGHNDEAIEHLERCLEMRLELFGDAHLRTASAHSSMAYVLEGMGRFQDALSHQVSCTKIRQAELSEDHSDFVESKQEMVRLAFVVASQSGGDVIPIRGSED